MNKLFKFAAFYAVIGIIGGVFFREFTKFNSFQGTTTLGFVHTHAFVLGMLFFLVLIAFEKLFKLSEYRHFGAFMITYNAGLLITLVMLVIRGITQVWMTPLSAGMDGAISGIAGLGHILLCIGLIYFFLGLKQKIQE